MRDIFGTAFAAALASLLGLGPSGAANLSAGPSAYEATAEAPTLPIWLVRFKLRQKGYQDIAEIDETGDGLAVRAHDRWGRDVRILVDRKSGEEIARPGYGLAHLDAAELGTRLDALGLAPMAPAAYRDGTIRVLARDADGARHAVRLDPITGTAWFEREGADQV
jgi:hypothetical protein